MVVHSLREWVPRVVHSLREWVPRVVHSLREWVRPPLAERVDYIQESSTMKRLPVAAGLVALFLLAGGCGGPPQIGPDEEAFKAVDALYTAVTSRSPKLLDQCDRKLQDLQT